MKYRFESPNPQERRAIFSIILNLRPSNTVYGPSGGSSGERFIGANVDTRHR
jgi:hypothetical protein